MKKTDTLSKVFGLMVVIAVVLTLGSVYGCSSGGGEKEEEPNCPAGTRNCPCRDDGTCDEGLVCKDNYCVPGEACPEGSEGCPCYGNGTCDEGLECQDGICQNPQCPAGTEGCPCIGGNTCNEGLTCHNGTCIRENCPEGTEGCPCRDGNQCDEGLICNDDGICESQQPVEGHGLFIGNENARACDVLFDVSQVGVKQVEFANSVKGRFKLENNKLAVSFISKSDEGFLGAVLVFQQEGGVNLPEEDLSKIQILNIKCYDRSGHELTDANEELK